MIPTSKSTYVLADIDAAMFPNVGVVELFDFALAQRFDFHDASVYP